MFWRKKKADIPQEVHCPGEPPVSEPEPLKRFRVEMTDGVRIVEAHMYNLSGKVLRFKVWGQTTWYPGKYGWQGSSTAQVSCELNWDYVIAIEEDTDVLGE